MAWNVTRATVPLVLSSTNSMDPADALVWQATWPVLLMVWLLTYNQSIALNKHVFTGLFLFLHFSLAFTLQSMG